MHGRSSGYTLIELVVVTAMLGMLLGFAAPRVAQQLFTSDVDEVEQWLNSTTTSLREKAQRTQTPLVLKIDMGGQQFFIETEAAVSAELEAEPQAALKLPVGIRINQVLLGQTSIPVNTEARIRFFPDGAADPAVLHVSDNDGQQFAWVIEPFLTAIAKLEGHGQYADYWQ